MDTRGERHVYGPVPSRRLGRSLGIDLVPFKVCTYDCIYCQLGRTTNKTLLRKEYVPVDGVMAELERKLAEDPKPDYISLAGSGEPTLNSGIGELIERIKNRTKVPVAVLTNGSLLWQKPVQDALMAVDLVLPSLDAGDERLFRYVNRPHEEIAFQRMVEGLTVFTERFPGEVWLEVFLLGGVTGIAAEAGKIAALVRRIRPARVQLNTVFRPPAEEFAYRLSEQKMLELKGLFPGEVEIIAEKEKEEKTISAFAQAGEGDILALLGRRPCTSADVANGLGIHATEALKRLEALRKETKITTVSVDGRIYYTVVVAP